MSETAVPEDIMAAAREAFRGGVGYPSDTPIADSALIIYIARAILAERSRCAKRVYDSVDEVPWLNRTELSEAIRNPKT